MGIIALQKTMQRVKRLQNKEAISNTLRHLYFLVFTALIKDISVVLVTRRV